MRVFNYSEARQKLASLLNLAKKEEVIIARKDGSRYKIVPLAEKKATSAFDVKGIDSDIKTDDILDIIRKNREYR